MKKGLFLALLMVAVVAMAFPAVAKAPIINDLPDIVLGDAGDISGTGTSATRLYRYLNVLNLFDPNVIVWRNNTSATEGNLSKYHVFLSQTGAGQAVKPSKLAALVNTLNATDYAALVGGTGSGATNTNIIDSATTFGFLSLIDTTLVGATAPTSAYTATAATNGMATSAVTAAMPLGSVTTDFAMAAAEIDLPSALVATKALTVVTMMDTADYTTGLAQIVLSYDFPGGSAQSWYALTNQGITNFGVATTAVNTVSGAIGWDATGGSGTNAGNYGTWYLSDNGTQAKFLIPAANMSGKVYRVRAALTSDQTAALTVCSYRIAAISYKAVAWQGIQVQTDGTEAEVPAPTVAAPLEAQIYFAVPYTLSEFGDTGAMNATDWVAADTFAPADGRDYNLTFDGIDIGDQGILLMNSCVIETIARPADLATPTMQWGGAGTQFTDAANGYVLATACPYTTLATLATGSSVSATQVTVGMGAMPTGSDAGKAKWGQASLNVATVDAAHKYTEVAGDLVRYTVSYNSPSPDTAPYVRFQTFAVNAAGAGQLVVWYDNFSSFDTRDAITNSGTVNQPGAPSVAGSVVDLYRYVAKTNGTNWLHFFWDAYGVPLSSTGSGATAKTAHGWADPTGSIVVTGVVVNGHLPKP